MTRASTIVVAALACVFMLAGCGSGDSGPQAACPPVAFSLAGEGGSVASVATPSEACSRCTQSISALA